MELFTKGSTVRLRSCHEKYLFAVDDEKSVRQSSNGTSRQSIWTVEMVPRKPNFIRLKSCYGKYLTASESSFLMGMTGEKAIQTPPFRQAEHESHWEPIRDDGSPVTVKLMSWNARYLRGNGGSPPWKNSVTHDLEPHTPTTKKWILWTVEIVYNPSLPPDPSISSFNYSVSDESNLGSHESIGSDLRSMKSDSSSKSTTGHELSAFEIFRNAKTVRLKSIAHDKYLIADDDEEKVIMGRNGSSKQARWIVELLPGSEPVIRLKSCHGGYLTASKDRFLLGATGHKVVQSIRNRTSEPEGEWEPVKEGLKVKLKSRNGGDYLRANGGVPPWRNSVTHDLPNRTGTQSWVVWDVDVVEIMDRPVN
ncbi:unnamed protein product [Cochlearia groenlandica]